MRLIFTLPVVLFSCLSCAEFSSTSTIVYPLSEEGRAWCKIYSKRIYDYCFQQSSELFSNPSEQYRFFQNLPLSNAVKRKRLENRELNGEPLVKWWEVHKVSDFEVRQKMGAGPIAKYNRLEGREIYPSSIICMVGTNNGMYGVYHPEFAMQECIGAFSSE